MDHNAVKASSQRQLREELRFIHKREQKDEQISKRQTEKYLLYILSASLVLLSVMLIYMVNEYFVLQNASTQYLQQHYEFDQNQSFYKQSADAYQKFLLRFIIIDGLICFFGLTSIILRKPWLYLLIIVMAFISVAYFSIL
ncbi:hypothetical protein [Catalinimonas niigatensis]|uniref:hypothetical protein n=1 Tax=Catalinimonas niigatensis TaxID=1397264 RepID=UPI00266654FA|nr:hypothetical protein [Catalinimonas niigatensis]WPP51099.1 hypothetical protein PZB72_01660 [Catalinimonas niigatensis]